MTTTRNSALLLRVALAASALLLFTGCAAAAPAAPEIATLQTASSGPGEPNGADTPSGAPTSHGARDPLFETYGDPLRLPLNGTEDQERAAWAPYSACYEDLTGVPYDPFAPADPEGDIVAYTPSENADPNIAAHESCQPLAPLRPWEYDAENPDAVAFVQKIVDCLKGKGVTYAEVDTSDGGVAVALGGPQNDSTSMQLGMQYYADCETDVANSR